MSSMFNLIADISLVQFLLTFSLSAVLMLFLTVCVFLIFRLGINRLFAYCKGGNFNIHIWAWFGYFTAKEGK